MSDNMDHLEHLPAVASGDVSVLLAKEATYKGSWKAAGGRSAWFMFRRNIDRLLNMCARVDFKLPPELWARVREDGLTLSPEQAAELAKCLNSEDIFALIQASPSGADGTVLACLRDLRRYAMLVEAEMVSRGVVDVERAPGDAGATPLTAETRRVWLQDFEEAEKRFLGTEFSSSSLSGLDQAAVAELVRTCRPSLALDEAECHRQTARVLDALKRSDLFTALADTLALDRGEVKLRLLAHAYSSPSIALPQDDPVRQRLDFMALRTILAITYTDWEPDALDASAAQGLQELAGGSVYEQAAVVSGETADEIALRYRISLYPEPSDRTEHQRLARAIAHAVNYHGLDARLNTPDHALAELLVPAVVAYLRGQTGGQLLDAGWRPGPGGNPVSPEVNEANCYKMLYEMGRHFREAQNESPPGWRHSLRELNRERCEPPLSDEKVDAIISEIERTVGGTEAPEWREASGPGTPEDGGHHEGPGWVDDGPGLERHVSELFDKFGGDGTVSVQVQQRDPPHRERRVQFVRDRFGIRMRLAGESGDEEAQMTWVSQETLARNVGRWDPGTLSWHARGVVGGPPVAG